MSRTTLIAALLLTAAPLPAFAQSAAAEATNAGPVVTLSVTETVDAAPDMATINTGVETRAPTAKEAMAQNAAKMDGLIKAMLKAGIERKDIRTNGINLNTQYDYSAQRDGQPPRFIGYIANNMLTVTVRKLDKAGETVDAMVDAGATNINGPVFSIADTHALADQARMKAIRTAGERAAFYAQAAGYRNARLLGISETGDSARPIVVTGARIGAMAAVAAPPTPIEPGQLSASITLNFRYMLER